MVSRETTATRQDPLQRFGPWGRKIAIGIVIVLAAVIGYFIFQKYLRVAATVLLLALLLTFLLQPVVEWLVRVSRWKNLHGARIAATLLLYLALGVMAYYTGAVVRHVIIHNADELQRTLGSMPYQTPESLLKLQRWYVAFVPEDVRLQLADRFQREISQLSGKYLNDVLASLLGLAKQAGQWLAFLVEMIFVPLLAFYFLTDAARLREQTLFFIPKRHRTSVLQHAEALGAIMRKYLHGQVILCAIAWVAVTLATLIMGVPGALLLGIIAGLSRAIPVIGPLIGGVPLLAAVLLNPHLSGAFWWVLIGFTALHFFETKFLMPRILGDQLGVHPVIVILSLLVGYEMLGLLGMFLAPPAVAMVRFLLAMHRDGGVQDLREQPLLPGLETPRPDPGTLR